jgi:His-Xaa-Ser system protein HxsD
MAHRCTLVLGARDGDALAVTLNFPDGVSATSQQAAEDEFHRHLLDEDLRACIRAETDALRGVILAHTFSRTDILLR